MHFILFLRIGGHRASSRRWGGGIQGKAEHGKLGTSNEYIIVSMILRDGIEVNRRNEKLAITLLSSHFHMFHWSKSEQKNANAAETVS